MNKQVKNEIVNLVKELNEKNVKIGSQEYELQWKTIRRERYSIKICYDIFFNDDLRKLFVIISQYNLYVILGKSWIIIQ